MRSIFYDPEMEPYYRAGQRLIEQRKKRALPLRTPAKTDRSTPRHNPPIKGRRRRATDLSGGPPLRLVWTNPNRTRLS
jgi:hypothetical protein